jgi:Flp pilus assembly protein TadD
MPRKKKSTQEDSTPEDTAELLRRREDAFRPARFLGYSHNTLAVYMMEREAYPVAEAELRRAVWLNPYEPAFMANLAWCLHKQKRGDEARECLKQAIEQGPDSVVVRHIADLMGVTVGPGVARGGDETRT